MYFVEIFCTSMRFSRWLFRKINLNSIYSQKQIVYLATPLQVKLFSSCPTEKAYNQREQVCVLFSTRTNICVFVRIRFVWLSLGVEKRTHAGGSFSSPLPKNSDAPMVAAEIASARAPRRKLQDMQICAPPTDAEKCESNNWRAAS
jgi:hypothetical protein